MSSERQIRIRADSDRSLVLIQTPVPVQKRCVWVSRIVCSTNEALTDLLCFCSLLDAASLFDGAVRFRVHWRRLWISSHLRSTVRCI